MRSYEASAISTRPPEELWAQWIDVAHWSDGDAVEWAQLDGAFEVGSVIRTKASGFPKSTLTITAVQPCRLWVDEARSPGMRMTFEHLIEPLTTGTKVTERALIRGPLAPIVGPLMRRKLERLLAASTEFLVGTAGERAGRTSAAG